MRKARVGAALLSLAVMTWTAPAPATSAEGRTRAQIRLTPRDLGMENELFGVSFGDAQQGHIVGTDGLILATVDGGVTWQVRDHPPLKIKERDPGESRELQETLFGVSFPDAQHGYAVGEMGSVLATSDGGRSWVLRPLPAPSLRDSGGLVQWAFRSVSFSDPQVGYVSGGGGAILATTDGGASWSVTGDPRFGTVMAVSSVDRTHGYAVAEGGISFVTVATSDGGRTWEPRAAEFQEDIGRQNFEGVSFTDSIHGYVVGKEGRIVATSDGGRTWRLQRGGGAEHLSGVAFVDARRGVAVGTVTFTTGEQKGLVLATDDGGQTWVSRIAPDVAQLHEVDFLGRDAAIAVGCARSRGTTLELQCQRSGLVRIDFVNAPPEDSSGGGLPVLALVGGGAALLLLIAVFGRRRKSVR